MASIIKHLRQLPQPQPLLQGIVVPARNFLTRYGERFQSVFGGTDERRITRADVFHAFSLGDEIGCLTALAWGFPRGGRPGGKSLEPALNAIPHFQRTLQTIRQHGLCAETYKTINSRSGVKNGVTTKVLYFGTTRSVSGAEALIYDSRVQTHLLERNWDEYLPLTRTLRAYRLTPTAAEYLLYLNITSEIARESEWNPAAIEMFMFGDAPGRRRAAHG